MWKFPKYSIPLICRIQVYFQNFCFLTAILTIIGVFDKLAKIGGAGCFVPISGFANSVVSPALEFKAEGHILGTGAKMFNLAGPVIVYGCGAASVYGLIYWIIEKI